MNKERINNHYSNKGGHKERSDYWKNLNKLQRTEAKLRKKGTPNNELRSAIEGLPVTLFEIQHTYR